MPHDLLQLKVNIKDEKTVVVSHEDEPVAGETAWENERLWQSLQVLKRLVLAKALQEREDFELLGSCLFDYLFTGEVRAAVKRWLRDLPSSDVASGQGPILRIVLQFGLHSGELAGLPWEYLHIPGDFLKARMGFVAAQEELVLSRQIKLPDQEEIALPIPAEEQLRIFVGIASPEKEEDQEGRLVDLPNISDQLADFVGVLERSGAKVESDFALTRERLYAVLRNAPDAFRPHVVHLVAHGAYNDDTQRGVLALCDPDRPKLAAWTSDSDLADCLAHRPSVVFLHACSGAKTGQIRGLRGVAMKLVEHGVPAVVAMNFEIDSSTAKNFAIKVYEELAKGVRIDEAVQIGRWQIGTGGRPGGNFSGRAFGCPVAFVQVPGVVILPTEKLPVAAVPAAGTLLCPRGHAMLPGMKRCTECGRWVELCPNPTCGKLWSPDDGLCPWCGYAASETGARVDVGTAPSPAMTATARAPSTAPSMGPAVSAAGGGGLASELAPPPGDGRS